MEMETVVVEVPSLHRIPPPLMMPEGQGATGAWKVVLNSQGFPDSVKNAPRLCTRPSHGIPERV